MTSQTRTVLKADGAQSCLSSRHGTVNLFSCRHQISTTKLHISAEADFWYSRIKRSSKPGSASRGSRFPRYEAHCSPSTGDIANLGKTGHYHAVRLVPSPCSSNRLVDPDRRLKSKKLFTPAPKKGLLSPAVPGPPFRPLHGQLRPHNRICLANLKPAHPFPELSQPVVPNVVDPSHHGLYWYWGGCVWQNL